MAKATLIFRERRRFDDGAIVETKLWRLPFGQMVRGSAHPYKYSLFYDRSGTRIVAYDNEAGKGDHVHRGHAETPYRFTTVGKLMSDFLGEVAALRGETL